MRQPKGCSAALLRRRIEKIIGSDRSIEDYFRGSVDDWIHIGGPGVLADQVTKYVKHLGRESMYELF